MLIYVGRRFTLGQGNLFALYVMGYTAGRGWIEALREDHANHILGVRLNDWTALLVFIGGGDLVLRAPQPPRRLALHRQAAPAPAEAASGVTTPSAAGAAEPTATPTGEADDRRDQRGRRGR